MNWWIAIAILMPCFMVTMFTSWLYYAKAMSAAHPGIGVNLDNKQYWEMLKSNEPLVVYFRAKYRLFTAISLLFGAGIAVCMFNAPQPRIN
jgi:hypothetical protein